MTSFNSSGLDAFIEEQCEKHSIRIGKRLPIKERLEKLVEMICEKQGYTADKGDIRILTSIIFLRYSSDKNPSLWMNEVIRWLPKDLKNTAIPCKEVRFTDILDHQMVHRSQTAKLP